MTRLYSLLGATVCLAGCLYLLYSSWDESGWSGVITVTLLAVLINVVLNFFQNAKRPQNRL